MDTALILAVIMVGLFAAYNLFHYMLFLLVTHPRDAGDIGHATADSYRRECCHKVRRLVVAKAVECLAGWIECIGRT